jgi:uncharacterized LabA/DUF88 family protein
LPTRQVHGGAVRQHLTPRLDPGLGLSCGAHSQLALRWRRHNTRHVGASLSVDQEPPRVAALIDGQNFTNALKEAFGMRRPTLNLPAIVNRVCQAHGWKADEVRFYTGVVDAALEPDLHAYWMRRLSQYGRQPGVSVWTRHNSYAARRLSCDKCGEVTLKRVGREKGVDLRIALDATRLAHEGRADVILLFTQDQDFYELVKELRYISERQGRDDLVVASAFPLGTGRRRGGIRGTLQIPLSREDIVVR